MSSLGETLLQAVRAACRQAFGLTHAQVIPADDRGPRPELPYLTVRVGTVAIPAHAAPEVLPAPLVRATVGDDVEGASYTLVVDGTTYTVVRDDEDTDATVATALAAAIWADHAADDDAVAAVSGADVLLHPGTGGELAVTASTPNLTITDDEGVDVLRGGYDATLTVQGFGADAAPWVEGLELALRRADVQAVQDAAGVDLRCPGGVINVAELLDTAIEPRWSREVEASYTAVALGIGPDGLPIVVPLVTLAEVDTDLELRRRDGDADPLSTSLVSEAS